MLPPQARHMEPPAESAPSAPVAGGSETMPAALAEAQSAPTEGAMQKLVSQVCQFGCCFNPCAPTLWDPELGDTSPGDMQAPGATSTEPHPPQPITLRGVRPRCIDRGPQRRSCRPVVELFDKEAEPEIGEVPSPRHGTLAEEATEDTWQAPENELRQRGKPDRSQWRPGWLKAQVSKRKLQQRRARTPRVPAAEVEAQQEKEKRKFIDMELSWSQMGLDMLEETEIGKQRSEQVAPGARTPISPVLTPLDVKRVAAILGGMAALDGDVDAILTEYESFVADIEETFQEEPGTETSENLAGVPFVIGEQL
eukprot:TRINITY_DN15651_c0_g1_i3.p1 TRINITY_DN15651_c0_g1~~TRINITY_DN15651_c0_g1_i3.p1  ORF type:complete len:310 (+),score=45.52 TRINITY_DN15651_c0_g1_i3:180-1109(+)